MSNTVAINIRNLIRPWMLTLFTRPTADDGLHLVGYDRHGYWQEFFTLEQATQFANSERWADMRGREATP